MSTLVTQTISNGTVSTSSTNVIQGSAKAWVNFDGTSTVSIRSSFNVSSITDNGTGDYTVNFTNALPNTNYAITGFVRRDNDVGGVFSVLSAIQTSTKTTAACRIGSFFQLSGSTSPFDSPEVDVIIFSN
jgi:hypothetical protein